MHVLKYLFVDDFGKVALEHVFGGFGTALYSGVSSANTRMQSKVYNVRDRGGPCQRRCPEHTGSKQRRLAVDVPETIKQPYDVFNRPILSSKDILIVHGRIGRDGEGDGVRSGRLGLLGWVANWGMGWSGCWVFGIVVGAVEVGIVVLVQPKDAEWLEG